MGTKALDNELWRNTVWRNPKLNNFVRFDITARSLKKFTNHTYKNTDPSIANYRVMDAIVTSLMNDKFWWRLGNCYLVPCRSEYLSKVHFLRFVGDCTLFRCDLMSCSNFIWVLRLVNLFLWDLWRIRSTTIAVEISFLSFYLSSQPLLE